jgi:hypothetical protein
MKNIMTENLRPESSVTLRGNYVLLSAGTLDILLPQHEVGAADYLDGALESSEIPGLLTLTGTQNPLIFVALSEQMTLLTQCPPERFIVTSLGYDHEEIRWCWNELRILIDVELQEKPLPAMLLTENTPVNQYIEFEGKLAYLCSTDKLCRFALAFGNE